MFWPFLRKLLFTLPAECAHGIGSFSLKLFGLIPLFKEKRYITQVDSQMSQTYFGVRFPQPFGLAAGFDKNGELVPGIQKLGFGFTEVGTVTPKPQPGNEKPRLFRYPQKKVLINRMGFNNHGAEKMRSRLQPFKKSKGPKIPVGINLGKNKTTPNEDALLDYQNSLKVLWELGDYFVINISSPNTPHLRELFRPDSLAPLLKGISETRKKLLKEYALSDEKKPLFLKLSPDSSEQEILQILDTGEDNGVQGYIICNTSTKKDSVFISESPEEGGMSGEPLHSLSNRILKLCYTHLKERGSKHPFLIAVGGVFSASDAYEKIKLGASLVQAYTGFIYEGPGFPVKIYQGLKKFCVKDGFSTISEAIGSNASRE